MKKLISTLTTTRSVNTLVLALFILVLTSCNKSAAEQDRVMNVFAISMLQILNIVAFGTIGLIFAIIGYSNGKTGYRIVGGVVGGLFTLIALMSFLIMSSEYPAKNIAVYAIFITEFIIATITILFSVMKSKAAAKASTANIKSHADALEDIINEDDEIV